MSGYKLVLIAASIIALSAQHAAAQLSGSYPGYSQHYYKGMRYGFFKPDDYEGSKSYPLIVYLHGSTDTVSRPLAWYEPRVQGRTPCFVLSPKTTEANQGWGNTWDAGHAPATQRTLLLIDSLVKSYNIDGTRLYVYGISMGAFGVFALLAREPGKFAAAYAVCGGSNVAAASKISTPLWIFHGTDDDVVPVRLSRNFYDEMVRLGNRSVRYTEYPGVKHNSWENVSRERLLPAWLFRQQQGRKGSVPAPVTDLSIQIQHNSAAQLRWQSSHAADEIWYYKIFRDGNLLAEVDGDISAFSDHTYKNNTKHSYHIVAVNYFFGESVPSVKVSLAN